MRGAYAIELRFVGDVRSLRQLLKLLLRKYGLRCVGVRPLR